MPNFEVDSCDFIFDPPLWHYLTIGVLDTSVVVNLCTGSVYARVLDVFFRK